jgi:hypothetical protein
MRKYRNAYRILVGKTERQKKTTWKTQVQIKKKKKMGLKGTGWKSTDWIHLAQDRDRRSPVEHGNEISGSTKFDNLLTR